MKTLLSISCWLFAYTLFAGSSTVVFHSSTPDSGVSIVLSTTVTNAAVTADPSSVTALTNSDVEFTATATGNLLSYYWITNSTLAVNGSTLSGATTTSLILSNVVIGQSNMPVAFIASNYCGSVTSAVATLTVTNSPGGGGGGGATNFVTGFSKEGAFGTDMDLWVGCSFQVASITNVYSLGRWVVSGDSQTHTIVIVNHDISTIVASNQVNCAGAPTNAFVRVNLPSPVSLTNGVSYYLLSRELPSGGDRAYSGYLGDTIVTFNSGIGNIAGSVWVSTNDVLGTPNIYTGSGWTYGPVDISVGP